MFALKLTLELVELLKYFFTMSSIFLLTLGQALSGGRQRQIKSSIFSNFTFQMDFQLRKQEKGLTRLGLVGIKGVSLAQFCVS